MITWFQPASQMEPLTPFLTHLPRFLQRTVLPLTSGLSHLQFLSFGVPSLSSFSLPYLSFTYPWIQGQWDLLGEVLPEQPSFQ